jgi:hypothetical protein
MNDKTHSTAEPEIIGVPDALALAHKRGINCVYATMIKWVRENNLGYQALGEGSRWNITKHKLEEFLTHGPQK